MDDPRDEMLAKLKAAIDGRVTEKESDPKTTWPQVAALTLESKALRHKFQREIKRIQEEDEMLFVKHQALEAHARAVKKEFWNQLYKVHNLPVDRYYSIVEDTIRMEPGTCKK